MWDKSLVLILLNSFLVNAIYGLASPFLPALLDEAGVDSVMTGLIFASFAIAVTIVSPIVGKLLDKFEHRKMMSVGCILMAISCASFGFVQYTEDPTLIVACAITLRLLQGKSQKTIFSDASLNYV